MSTVAVAPGVRYRHLTIAEVRKRQRAQSAREVAVHNGGIVEALHLEQIPPRRDQVLDLFGPTARRLAR